MSPNLARRDFLMLGGGTLAASWVLAACGTGSGGSSPSSSAKNVTYWAAFATPEGQKYFQQNFVDAFNKSQKNVSVKMDVKQLMTLGSLTNTTIAAGKGADVVYADGPSAALSFAKGSKIVALDEYATKYGWQDKLLPWAYDVSKVDGKLYSVPIGYGSLVLYYNPDTFAEHGWKVPTTLAEFETVCADAKSKGLIPVGAGNSGYKAQTEWYLTCVLNAAVGPNALHEALTGARKWDDKAFVDAISMLKSQIDKGWWGGSADRYFTNTDTDMFTGLANGKVAMYMTGTWSFDSADTFFTDGKKWDWAPLPSLNDAVPAGVYPLAIGTTLSVNARSENPAASAEFINYMIADPSRMLGLLAATGTNPAPLKVDPSTYPAEVDERVARLYKAIPETRNLGYASWSFVPPKTDTYLYTEFDKVITGTMSPAEFCAGLQETFAAELASGSVPKPFVPES
ncbi:ABC transporter substrate-binding protein [Streptosporangium roseum]|uniref:ABC transporter substrate-binding protein n=1 Tax=Streptosporangium roseum TaxID=2001 RepID=UPI0004CD3E49|nr:extracellular solute-binding protein [Streptosporangium roseum]